MKSNQLLQKLNGCCWNETKKTLPIAFALLLFSFVFQVQHSSAQSCCSNVTNGGTISCNESNCSGYDPACIINVTYPCGGTGTLEYKWLVSTNNFYTSSVIAGATSSSYNPVPITQTTYYKRLSKRSGCGDYVGCSNIVVKYVTSPPSCSITGTCNICQGETTQLCAPSGCSTYHWNTGATSRCITTGSAGTYTVTVTNSGGCSSTCNRTVTVTAPAPCTITGGNSCCQGQSLTLCAPVGCSSYSWSNGAHTRTINVNCSGTYSCTVTNSNGCSSTCSQCVTVCQPPSCSITGCNSFCQGQTSTLCAPSGCATYVWNTGATSRCIDVSASGTYTVTVTNSGGCSSTSTRTVTVTGVPNCSITGNNCICWGQTTVLTAEPNCQGYLWSTGATTQCISVCTSGTYTVTVTNNNGCNSTCSRTVTVNQLPSCLISGNTSICDGQCTTLSAEPNCAGYLWTTGETTQCISVHCAGTYGVRVTNQGGCSASGSVCVSVTPSPTCCITGCTNLWHGWCTTLSAPFGCNSYLWSNGATTRCITVWCPGTYCVTVTNNNGCSSTCSVCVSWYCSRTASSTGSEQIAPDANMETTGSVESTVFPNPFKTTTTFQFRNHGERTNTVVEIFSVDGAKISEIFNGVTESNELYNFDWNAEGTPNGMYLYRITSGDQVVNGRIIRKD